MSQRYVRPTIAGWLSPTLLAPWVSVFAFVTAFAVLGIDVGGRFGKIAGWLAGMLLGGAWTFVYCLLLVAVDVALLAVKVRTLPAGRKGWLTSFFSPLAVFAIYTVAPPYRFYAYGPWAIVAAIAAPMVLVASVARIVGGQKPLR